MARAHIEKKPGEANIPATVRAFLAFSPRTRNTTFRWLASTLWFSKKKTLSTPYSWSVLNLTKRPIVPAKAFSMTRFFLPLTWSLLVVERGKIGS